MGLFSALRAGRSDDRELGRGLWRGDHDRFRRAVDRFHQVLEGTEDDGLYAELLVQADRLGDLLLRVRALCAGLQASAPVDGHDVPGAVEPVHRALSRAANEAATAAQAAAMSRFEADRAALMATVERRVSAVVERIATAERAAG